MEKKFGEQYASIQDLVKDLVSGQTLTMFEVADHSEVLSLECEDLVPHSSCFSSSYQDRWPAK